MTETIFISKWLDKTKKYHKVYESLCQAFKDCEVSFRHLPYSEDIWCRDFMPVHIGGGKYVGYIYNPDYLQDEKPPYITEQPAACKGLDIDFATTLKITLDGGNYVRCGDKVVMTDKIFKENPEKSREELHLQLEEAFQAEVILLPWDTEERYGHADGMVAWLGGNRILLNNYSQLEKGEEKPFTKRLHKILGAHFDVTELRYDCELHKDSWCYLNYLETEKAIIMPALSENTDLDNDIAALELFQKIVPDKKVVQVYAEPLVKDGGALHCVTWELYR